MWINGRGVAKRVIAVEFVAVHAMVAVTTPAMAIVQVIVLELAVGKIFVTNQIINGAHTGSLNFYKKI